jgi:hypothetical protein
MPGFLADVRFGFRMLVKNRGLATIAVLAFALGIGLTTTTFSIVYGVLVRGLPFPRSDRLLHLEESRPTEGVESRAVSIPDFVDWRAQQTAFEDLSAFAVGTANLAGAGDRPERYSAAYTTANMFDLVRVRPHIGRGFSSADGHPGVRRNRDCPGTDRNRRLSRAGSARHPHRALDSAQVGLATSGFETHHLDPHHPSSLNRLRRPARCRCCRRRYPCLCPCRRCRRHRHPHRVADRRCHCLLRCSTGSQSAGTSRSDRARDRRAWHPPVAHPQACPA